MNKVKIKVDVVSDVVCPWCYIGKKRLEKAISQLPPNYEIDLQFIPFELNPDMPKQGRQQKEYLANKFGGVQRYAEITGRVTQVAKDEGLLFDFDAQEVSPNTRDAHRLIWLAKREGVQPQVKEALMSAYFEKGIDLTVKENLLKVVTNVGLDREKAKQLLESDLGLTEVEKMEQLNYQRRISGVPFYIIDNKYGISGAQPSEVFVQAITQVGNEIAAQGDACEIGEDC